MIEKKLNLHTNKHSYLYHGSQTLVDTIHPSQATGLGFEKEHLFAVYASQSRDFAIPFALPMKPDKNGNCLWSLSFSKDKTLVSIQSGQLDFNRVGYLYRVPVDTFEQIDKFQWISYQPVRPIDYEIIRPEEFQHLIEGRDR